MIWLWSPASRPPGASSDQALAHVEPMVWARPNETYKAIEELLAKPLSRRCMFVWHPEKHDPQAWSADRETRLIEGAQTEAGYRYWLDCFAHAKRRGVDGIAEIVVDYEGGGGGLNYWQMASNGKIAQALDTIQSAQSAKNLPASSKLRSIPARSANRRSHSKSVYEPLNQHVAELVNAWIRDTIARAYETTYGIAPRISNYGNATTPWPDINGKLNPVGTVNSTSAPTLYLRPNRGSRRAYLDNLLKEWESEPVGSAAWLSPGFRGDPDRFEMPDELDLELVEAVSRKAGSIILWTGDLWSRRDASSAEQQLARKRQHAACRMIASAVLNDR